MERQLGAGGDGLEVGDDAEDALLLLIFVRSCLLRVGRLCVADGEAGPGERLPLAKDMAAILGANKNTLWRALHILRDKDLLDFQRGSGITVAGTPERSAVMNRVRDLVEFCRTQGYRPDEVIQIIEGLS